MTINPSDLAFDYDEDDDILFVALRGSEGRPAVTYETDAGHLVRLDPRTYEFLGAEIPSYKARWEGRDIELEWSTPQRPWFLRWRGSRHEHATVGTRSLVLN